MAMSLSPLAPHPGYEHTAGFFPKGNPTDPTPLGCTRPEARAIALHQTQGTIARLLQYGDDPSQPKRKPPKPKNYSQLNYRRIKEMAVRGRRKREEAEQPQRPVTSSGKCPHTLAQANTHVQHTRPLTAPHSHSAPPPLQQSTPGQRPLTTTTTTTSKNFLADNICAASHHGNRKDPKQEHLKELQEKRERELGGHPRGQLPKYLVARRKQWKKEEEERLARQPDPSVPPGHSLMPEHERRHTLEVLRQHEASLTRELQSLPLRSDTIRQKQRRSQLETKLVEIEDALKIFSRPKVFVKLDE